VAEPCAYGGESVSNFYRDTDERYRNDPAFHTAVDWLQHMAREHGFTPGELKQIAFKAALELEMRSVRAWLPIETVIK
jgi:hypothetical protein